MSTFSLLLRRWRRLRELSQQELAEQAGLSPRHLSFLETGRAAPSRAMIERLVLGLRLTQPVRRELLEAGGFAAAWLSDGPEASVGEQLLRALGLVLQQHEPYPALLVEQGGAVRQVNAGALRLMQLFAEQPLREPWSMLGLLQALRSSFEDWEAVLGYTSAFFGAAPGSSLALATSPATAAELSPVFRFRLRRGQLRAHLGTLATQLSVASNAAEAGLRLELFHPLDEATELLLRGEP